MDKSNIVTVKFSNNVYVDDENSISTSNMKVTVNGPLEPYDYSWRVLDNPSIPLVPGREIPKFKIILTSFKETLVGDGSEMVTLTFINYTAIYDVYGNSLKDTPAKGSLKAFTYVDPNTA